jgi:hypothetical protein
VFGYWICGRALSKERTAKGEKEKENTFTLTFLFLFLLPNASVSRNPRCKHNLIVGMTVIGC